MKNLPIGIQAFSKLRENNCVYVDKTKEIYEMTNLEQSIFSPAPAALENLCF